MKSLSAPSECGEGETGGLTSEKNRPKDETELELVACVWRVFFTTAVLNGGGEGTGHSGGGHPWGMGEGGERWCG